MKKNYELYSFEDLLEDEYFISSILHPTKESEAFWHSQLDKGLLNRDNYELACFYIANLKGNYPPLSKEEIAAMWLHIKGKNQEKRPKRQTLFYIIPAVAASILILIASYRIWELKQEQPVVPVSTRSQIENIAKPTIETKDIQLVLSGNQHIAVKGNSTEIKYNEKGEAEISSPHTEETIEQDSLQQVSEYNQVIIPKGKSSSLILSDGTQIWLNASSRIVYPPVFEENKREIYLEGEAFLDVAPDKNKPFIVKTNQIEMEVLGTSFNISAYEQEYTQTIVLVSGSVKVKTPNFEKNGEVILSPNQLFRFREDNKTEVQTVNTARYISWKDGYYICEKDPLALIFKRLSNYYGIEIVYDKKVGEMKYSGKLDLKESPERVLEGLMNTAAISYKKEREIHYLNLKQ